MLGLKLRNAFDKARINIAIKKAEFSYKRQGHSLVTFDPELHPELEPNTVILYANQLWVVWGRSVTGSAVYTLARVEDTEHGYRSVKVAQPILLKDQVSLCDRSTLWDWEYEDLIHEKHNTRKEKLLWF